MSQLHGGTPNPSCTTDNAAAPCQGSFQPVEVFLSDIHGEHRAFSHLLRNGCGRIRQAIDQLFPAMDESKRANLAALAYYPRERAQQIAESLASEGGDDSAASEGKGGSAGSRGWLNDVCRDLGAVLTLLGGSYPEAPASLQRLEALAAAIRKASISRLHLVGDIYDRGPAPDLIMDELTAYLRWRLRGKTQRGAHSERELYPSCSYAFRRWKRSLTTSGPTTQSDLPGRSRGGGCG